jgi:hypothetical protein
MAAGHSRIRIGPDLFLHALTLIHIQPNAADAERQAAFLFLTKESAYGR